ncbi:phage protein, partial [Paenibacillus agricola]
VQEPIIPETNFGVVANSQALGGILYGRRYRIIVSGPDGTALDVSQLRCTFKIQKTLLQPPNFCEIVLYNLEPNTENAIIKEGNRIIVEAGYEGDQYGVIFDGDIIQPIRDKEDAVTYRLTLVSLDGDRFMNQGFVGFSVLKGQSSRNLVEQIASQAKVPAQIGSISDGFDKAELSRGKVVFGLAKDYLRQLAQTQDASFYMEDGKINLVKVTDPPEGEIIELSPASGLIGQPVQNDQGITFKSLLNPRIKINRFVRIDNSQIRAQTFQTGQIIRNLDAEGLYRVIGITYTGDTRGDAWECECETVSQAGILPGMVSAVTANPF